MSIIFLILPITLLLSLSAVAAFAWATRGGQFDDLRTPAVRALHDPTPVTPQLPQTRETPQ
jgi:cbb3-type cytochrome oxidase maturation protein